MSKSYIKWAGGKSQLAGELMRRFPAKFDRYIEPFCGSASLFFAFYGKEPDMFDCDIRPAFLNDSNALLVNTHLSVRDNVKSVLKVLHNIQSKFDAAVDKVEHYRLCRDEFNNNVVDMLSKEPWAFGAAAFILINKTCFNGLWRVNSDGKFNVPFNQMTNTKIYNKVKLLRCSELLNQAELSCGDFASFIESTVKKDDFVFLDPPYIPLSDTSNFTSYTEDGWKTPVDDNRLNDSLKIIDDRGAKFMMTNSNASLVYDVFGQWKIDTVEAHRFVKAINEPDSKREKVLETVITNY